jgi:hypothetical protein
MELLEPWRAVSFDESTKLEAELRRELANGHALFRQAVRAVARRIDIDDVLFSLEDGSNRVAVVHLTWSARERPPWPPSEIFATRSSWEVERMMIDRDAFGPAVAARRLA